MKPQELNQDEQKNTNGGFLTDGILGGSNNDRNHSGSSSDGSSHNDEGDSSNGLLGDLPLIGDIL